MEAVGDDEGEAVVVVADAVVVTIVDGAFALRLARRCWRCCGLSDRRDGFGRNAATLKIILCRRELRRSSAD